MRRSASHRDRLRLFLAHRLVALLRFLVPRRHRAVWLAEWHGELAYLAYRDHPGNGVRRGNVLAHSLHAIPHATAHFKHEWSFDMLLQDLQYAARRLIKAPFFALVAVVTIAIGVGANAAIFSVVDSTLLNPLPYPEADRLVFLWKQAPQMDLATTPRASDVAAWRERSTSFEEIMVYSGTTVTLTGGAEPLRQIGLQVLPGFFGFLGASPALGREFTEEEGRLSSGVVMISHGLWQSYFGGADDVVGRTLPLDDEPHTVVGVMPPDFHFQAPFDDAQLWLPLDLEDDTQTASPFAIARLRAGVSAQAASDELAGLAAAVTEETGEETWPGVARRAQDLHGERFETSLLMLQGAVAIVLLIACANVANLLLARGAGQGGEMAVRAAIGASRGRLLRQLFTEHLLLAGAGGLLGYGLARAAVVTISSLRPEQMTSLATVRVDGWIFFLTMGIAAVTGVLFGLIPALQASRPDLGAQLRQGTRSHAEEGSRSWLRNGLVVAEVALAMLLLVGAGLLFGSLFQLVNVDLGFETANVLTMSIALPEHRYTEDGQRRSFHDELMERVRSVGGDRIEAIGVSSGPLPTLGVWFGAFAAENLEPTDAFSNVAAHSGRISPGFFSALGVSMQQGRDFTAADVDHPDNPVIINATWARRMWGEQNVIGRRIRVDGREEPSYFRVIGVIDDVMLVGPTGAFGELQIFQPRGVFSYLALLVRTDGDPLSLVGPLKEQVWAIDPSLPIENVARLDEVYAGRLASQRFNVALLGGFAAIALLLAVIGVYGVLSYAVGRRTREIGIRMALGARVGDVVPMIAWQGLRMVVLGVLLGIAGAAGLTRFLESLLYEVSAVDPVIFAAVALVLIAVAAVACLVPAVRASRLDAMDALRGA